MSTDIDVNIEPLPGYRLIEHIGTGGYGEVWRVEAPGGLTKAIKFVFGQQHEKRATNELKALDHVRGVRHPFLLSLERIEVVNGRLLVVTELADGSVKDRFDACRQGALSGIPREELLGYLRDAADALDFMNESHALQHLDIKPENLLLLAGHVKVADFGLVKDVRQSQASLVGGMTPLYAAPEVFRGMPSRQSDQYSLAIVYLEMLTGNLPFVGCNAAELTLQHLNDEPDLSSLDAADRYVVSRALAKEPAHRYPSCREFIESLRTAALTHVRSEESAATADIAAEPTRFATNATRPAVPTDVFEDLQADTWEQTERLLVELAEADRALVDLPSCDLTSRDARATPTLILGIGGAAGRVLSQFRQLLHTRHRGASVPAVQLLLIDTDPRALAVATAHDGGLTADETLNLPLRRPQHYRDNAQQLITWLSRRWLYNIPRTLRTEGLRPLGRLALADHARQAGQRIRKSMSQALDPASTAASGDAIGRGFRSDAIRVFVVSAISGGTGGGMSLDAGYAARAILGKLGLNDAHICGLMMHSTGGDPRSCELARVNALSWMVEFNHFQQPHNCYPGDVSCGLPPHSPDVAPFDDTYLIHLGDNLSQVEFEQSTESVAEYLYLNTLSPASTFFEACREPKVAPATSSAEATRTLRSFGLVQNSAAPKELCDEFSQMLAKYVVANWKPVEQAAAASANNFGIGAPELRVNSSVDTKTRSAIKQLTTRLRLDAAGIAANARTVLEVELGGNSSDFLSQWLTSQARDAQSGGFATIDRLFASDSLGQTLRGKPVAAIIEPFTKKLLAEVRQWAISQLDDCASRVVGARQGLAALMDHCRGVDAGLQRLRGAVTDTLLELKREITVRAEASKTKSLEPEFIQQSILNYFCLRLDQVAILAAEHSLRLLICEGKDISEQFTLLGREIDQIARAMSRACGDTSPNESSSVTASDAGQDELSKLLHAKLPEMAVLLDKRLQQEFIHPQGGLAKVVMAGGRIRAQLTTKLNELAEQVVEQTLVSDSSVTSSAGGNNADANSDLRSAVATATPTLVDFGGTRRVLAVLPRDAGNDVRVNAAAVNATSTKGNDNSLTVCVEVGSLSTQHIAAALIEYRRDRVEFAGRVHSRTDVEWAPLLATTTSPEPVAWPNMTARQTQPRDAMCKTLVM